MNFNWTEEKLSRLKELIKDKWSYEDIRLDLDPSGNLSRSAVAGKARRKGLSQPLTDKRRSENATRARNVRELRRVQKPLLPQIKPGFIPKEDTTLQPTRSYAELESDECKWPYGDDPKSFEFCGRPRMKLDSDRLHPYCEHHREISRRGKTETADDLQSS